MEKSNLIVEHEGKKYFYNVDKEKWQAKTKTGGKGRFAPEELQEILNELFDEQKKTENHLSVITQKLKQLSEKEISSEIAPGINKTDSTKDVLIKIYKLLQEQYSITKKSEQIKKSKLEESPIDIEAKKIERLRDVKEIEGKEELLPGLLGKENLGKGILGKLLKGKLSKFLIGGGLLTALISSQLDNLEELFKEENIEKEISPLIEEFGKGALIGGGSLFALKTIFKSPKLIGGIAKFALRSFPILAASVVSGLLYKFFTDRNPLEDIKNISDEITDKISGDFEESNLKREIAQEEKEVLLKKIDENKKIVGNTIENIKKYFIDSANLIKSTYESFEKSFIDQIDSIKEKLIPENKKFGELLYGKGTTLTEGLGTQLSQHVEMLKKNMNDYFQFLNEQEKVNKEFYPKLIEKFKSMLSETSSLFNFSSNYLNYLNQKKEKTEIELEQERQRKIFQEEDTKNKWLREQGYTVEQDMPLDPAAETAWKKHKENIAITEGIPTQGGVVIPYNSPKKLNIDIEKGSITSPEEEEEQEERDEKIIREKTIPISEPIIEKTSSNIGLTEREQAFTNIISKYESSDSDPYNVIYGGEKYKKEVGMEDKNLTDMTINEVLELQKKLIAATKGKISKGDLGTSAVGKGQFISSTLQSQLKSLGIDESKWDEVKFTPELQDKLIIKLAKSSGIDVENIEDMLGRNFEEVKEKIGKQWEAFRPGFKGFDKLESELKSLAEIPKGKLAETDSTLGKMVERGKGFAKKGEELLKKGYNELIGKKELSYKDEEYDWIKEISKKGKDDSVRIGTLVGGSVGALAATMKALTGGNFSDIIKTFGKTAIKTGIPAFSAAKLAGIEEGETSQIIEKVVSEYKGKSVEDIVSQLVEASGFKMVPYAEHIKEKKYTTEEYKKIGTPHLGLLPSNVNFGEMIDNFMNSLLDSKEEHKDKKTEITMAKQAQTTSQQPVVVNNNNIMGGGGGINSGPAMGIAIAARNDESTLIKSQYYSVKTV